jgi:hypothetical protein
MPAGPPPSSVTLPAKSSFPAATCRAVRDNLTISLASLLQLRESTAGEVEHPHLRLLFSNRLGGTFPLAVLLSTGSRTITESYPAAPFQGWSVSPILPTPQAAQILTLVQYGTLDGQGTPDTHLRQHHHITPSCPDRQRETARAAPQIGAALGIGLAAKEKLPWLSSLPFGTLRFSGVSCSSAAPLCLFQSS